MEMSDRVIGRIRKMLALANDAGASAGERDNALRMVHATLAKYNLDLAAVGDTPEKSVEPRIKHLARFYGRPWARIVADAIGDLMFCKYLYIAAGKAKDTVHLFIGSYANAVSAATLAEFVISSIMKEGRARQRANGEGNAYFRSFAIGAARTVARRCAELRSAATAPAAAAGGAAGAANGPGAAIPGAPGTGIVLRGVYDREAEANERYVSESITVRKPEDVPKHDLYRRTRIDPMLEGCEYGERIPLNRQVK